MSAPALPVVEDSRYFSNLFQYFPKTLLCPRNPTGSQQVSNLRKMMTKAEVVVVVVVMVLVAS